MKSAPVASATNDFAFKLYEKLSDEKGNVLFSPFSISCVLAMLCVGAERETRDQMKKVLGLPDEDESWKEAYCQFLNLLENSPQEHRCEIQTANALWAQSGYEIIKDYRQLIEARFQSGLYELDFSSDPDEAGGEINQWVIEKTKGKIENLIAPGTLTTLTRFVLTNAIYFLGFWKLPFMDEMTEKAPFKMAMGTSPDDEVEVDLMSQEESFRYYAEDDFQFLELPYEGDQYSFVALLPSKVEGLQDLEKRLTSTQLDQWIIKANQRVVQVFLPKFKIEPQILLAEILQAMGMVNAFDPHSADFSKISSEKFISVSQVIHKTFIEVNEKSTEAAAATAVMCVDIEDRGEPLLPPVFRADHPFIFMIRQRQTGCILFMGRLLDPRE